MGSEVFVSWRQRWAWEGAASCPLCWCEKAEKAYTKYLVLEKTSLNLAKVKVRTVVPSWVINV